MRNLWRVFHLLSIIVCLVATRVAAAPPVHLWSHGFGDASAQTAYLVAIDNNGDVVVGGDFGGTIDFGGGPMTAVSQDIFLAKFTANGLHVWSKQFNGGFATALVSIAIDASNQIVISGDFDTSIDFGGGALNSAGGRDIFLATLDANGSHVWSKRFGDVGNEHLPFMRLSSAGDIGLAAAFDNSVDFGGGALTSAGGDDIAAVKLDSAGNHIWSDSYGDANASQFPRGIAFDAAGNMVILVQYRGSMDFGGGPLASAGDWDIGLAKFDGAGVHLWSERFGNAVMQLPRSLAVDGLDNVVISGYSSQSLDLGGGPLPAGAQDVFAAKYDAGGNHLWSHSYGDASVQQGAQVSLDAANNVFLTGLLIGSMDFGGGPVTSAGGSDMFVAKLDPNGNHVFSTHYGGTGSEVGNDIAVNPAGNVMVLAGTTDGSVDFGGGAITSEGQTDAVVAAFAVGEPVPVLIQSFQATARAGSIELSWDIASTPSEIASVTLWRRDATSAMQRVFTTPFDANTNRYIDNDVVAGQRYEYQLSLTTTSGDMFQSPLASAATPGFETRLEANYPNPFNPRTTIPYVLGSRTSVTIVIYDAAGREVARLEEGMQESGRRFAEWDGHDAAGKSLASGVYFYRLEGAARVEARKMLLLK